MNDELFCTKGVKGADEGVVLVWEAVEESDSPFDVIYVDSH